MRGARRGGVRAQRRIPARLLEAARQRPSRPLRYWRPRGGSWAAPFGVPWPAEALGRVWAVMECARFPRLAPAAASAPAFLRRSGADWRLRRRVRWGRGQARGWGGRRRETESRWQGSIVRGWHHFLWLPERIPSLAMLKGHGPLSLSTGPVPHFSFPLAEPRGPALTTSSLDLPQNG